MVPVGLSRTVCDCVRSTIGNVRITMRALLLLCLLALSARATASEAVDKALTTWDKDLTNALETQAKADARATERTCTALVYAAQSAARRGDIAAATDLWKEILSIDEEHAKAREFFTAIGTLDAMIAEINTPVDLLGNPLPPPPAVPLKTVLDTDVTITANPAQTQALGALLAGTTLTLSYRDGTWNPKLGGGRLSPDDAVASKYYRLTVVDTSRKNPIIIAFIPPETANKPFTVTLTQDYDQTALMIHPPTSERMGGNVTYHLIVASP